MGSAERRSAALTLIRPLKRKEIPLPVRTVGARRAWLEYMDWAQDLLVDPLLPVKGFTTPRDTPGAGLDWNEKAIAPCLVAT